MFTGIIKQIGTVESIGPLDEMRGVARDAPVALQGETPQTKSWAESAGIPASQILRLTIACEFAKELSIDESVSVNGVCLTVTDLGSGTFSADVVPETLSKTTLGSLKPASRVNLERALRLNEALGGHLVQGHVDTTGSISEIKDLNGNRTVWIACPSEARDHLIERGSITVDGVSLTIARSEPSQNRFMVAIIPYTWENTGFKNYREGDRVNLEFDVIGKYVLQFLKNRETVD